MGRSFDSITVMLGLSRLAHGLWECGECGLVDERGFDDDHWVRQAHRVRDERVRRPSQSKFRVVAVVVYERGDGTVSHVIGHNDEAACLKNSICAERAAFVQLCMLPQSACSRVTAVYIASDAAEPITPGALCREFMMSSPLTSTDTRIVMEGGGRRLDLRLAGLYPHASPYIRLTAEEQAAAGRRLGPAVRPFPAAHEQQAWRGAVNRGGWAFPDLLDPPPRRGRARSRRRKGTRARSTRLDTAADPTTVPRRRHSPPATHPRH